MTSVWQSMTVYVCLWWAKNKVNARTVSLFCTFYAENCDCCRLFHHISTSFDTCVPLKSHCLRCIAKSRVPDPFALHKVIDRGYRETCDMFRKILHTRLVPANLVASKRRAKSSRISSFRTRCSENVGTQNFRVRPSAVFLLARHIWSMQEPALVGIPSRAGISNVCK